MAKISKGRGKGLSNVTTVVPEPGEIICIQLSEGEIRVFNPTDPGVAKAVAFYPRHNHKVLVKYQNESLGVSAVAFEEAG